jgi:hypothetical protein
MGALLATGCCHPKQVAVVKKPAVLAPTGPVIVKEYTIPGRPVIVSSEPPPKEIVVVVVSNPPPARVESAWYFTGIRWVWLP